MYTCRSTLRMLRTLNLLLHSFVLWVIQRALKCRTSLQCQFLNLYSGTSRIMPRRGRAVGREWKESLRNLENSFRVVHGERIGSSYYTHSARVTSCFTSPKILLNEAVDQVWVKITGRCPRKDFQKTAQIDVEKKEDNDGNNKYHNGSY